MDPRVRARRRDAPVEPPKPRFGSARHRFGVEALARDHPLAPAGALLVEAGPGQGRRRLLGRVAAGVQVEDGASAPKGSLALPSRAFGRAPPRIAGASVERIRAVASRPIRGAARGRVPVDSSEKSGAGSLPSRSRMSPTGGVVEVTSYPGQVPSPFQPRTPRSPARDGLMAEAGAARFRTRRRCRRRSESLRARARPGRCRRASAGPACPDRPCSGRPPRSRWRR